MTVITLSGSELTQGALVGVMRRVRNVVSGTQPAHGQVDNIWQADIEGALGEMALAKFLNVFWAGTGVYRAPDVDQDDVRTTTPGRRLILHPSDPDDRRFWLVTGGSGRYEIQGWIMGGEGKRDQYWHDPGTGRPAFFVPASDLRPPESS